MPRLGFSSLAHKLHEETHHHGNKGNKNTSVNGNVNHSGTHESRSPSSLSLSLGASSPRHRPLDPVVHLQDTANAGGININQNTQYNHPSATTSAIASPSSPLAISTLNNSLNNNQNHHLNSTPMNHSHSSSKRSFFGLSIRRSHSNESQSSIMSDDNYHGHGHGHGSLASPQHSHGGKNGSMVQLKKFFRPARRTNDSHLNLTSLNPPNSSSYLRKPQNVRRNSSNPSLSTMNKAEQQKFSTQPSTPTFTHDANNNMIVKTDQKFWDDLEGSVTKKYGKLGKVLGSGAGGSVRLIVRESDGVTFAVKEFVARRPNESVKDYAKKCTAEFCIGSTLHHPNIIQTLDIINENNHFFEVMEYAPIDFFAVVMSGQMTRSEINCCFKQITLGVSYLHSVGLAHRDLKLDNCVVTKDGIVKLIDFGSAVVFKYPFEDDIVMAHGIVGSDPYLAPEVLTSTSNYDPRFVDIWSIAIIYCCMTLRRFPWKAPKQEDPSFNLYCMEDDQPHDYVESARKHKELLLERRKKIEKMKQEQLQSKANEGEVHEGKDQHKEDSNVKALTEKVENIKIDEEAQSEKQMQYENPQQTQQPETTKQQPQPESSQQIQKPETTPQQQDQDEQPQQQPQQPGQEHEKQHHHHHHEGTSDTPERRALTKTSKQIHGPYRLMRLLPHASRPIISRMLSVDVSKRATMQDILNDEWFSDIKYCTIDKDGHTVNDPGHHHTIV